MLSVRVVEFCIFPRNSDDLKIIDNIFISVKIGLTSGMSETAVPIIQSLGELIGER
jgi:hypothetical protein